MGRYMPVIGTALGALVTAFTPQIQDLLMAYPTVTSIAAGIAGVFLALAKSPRQ